MKEADDGKMWQATIEVLVGLFIALGLAALVLLAAQVSGIGETVSAEGFQVTARFSNVGQLRPKAPVKMAGVTVGSVRKIELDQNDFSALVLMSIAPGYDQLPLDTAAQIYTSGLLGEQYVSLKPGGEDDFLQEGDEIIITSDAVVLEDVVSKFLYSRAAGDE